MGDKDRLGQIQDSILVDENNRKAIIDSKSNAITSISFPHHEIHDGDMYSICINADESVGNAIEIALRPPDSTKRFHTIFNYTTEAKGNFALLENVPSLAGGTNAIPINRNRNSGNTSSALTAKVGTNGVSALTYGVVGNTLCSYYFGTNKAGAEVGGGARSSSEWLIKNNVDTVFRLESDSANNELSLEVLWYEHTDSN